MPLLDLDAFRRAPLAKEPFTFTVVPQAIRPADAEAIKRDFPVIDHSGLLPVEATQYGPKFGELVEEMRSEATARAFSEKFGIDLVGRPTMITVRGRCAARDGRIHTDSETKVVTVLIYFNDAWEAKGGRLRLLRSPDNLNDMIDEVPPDLGTMIAFRRSDNSYHGHEP
jgi:SM-20-related protein